MKPEARPQESAQTSRHFRPGKLSVLAVALPTSLSLLAGCGPVDTVSQAAGQARHAVGQAAEAVTGLAAKTADDVSKLTNASSSANLTFEQLVTKNDKNGYPRLLFTKADEPKLKKAASGKLHGQVAGQAKKDCLNTQLVDSGNVEQKATAIETKIDGCTVMFVVSGHDKRYLAPINDALKRAPGYIGQVEAEYNTAKAKDLNVWTDIVPGGTGAATLLVAEDVAHDYLPQTTVSNAEAAFRKHAAFARSYGQRFYLGGYGFQDLYDLSVADSKHVKPSKDKSGKKVPATDPDLQDQLASDTKKLADFSFTEYTPESNRPYAGCEYEMFRKGSTRREVKQLPMYALYHTGYYKNLLKDPRTVKATESLLESCFSDNNIMVGFQDAGQIGRKLGTDPERLLFTAGSDSKKAGGLAAWRRDHIGNYPVPSSLLTYVETHEGDKPRKPQTQVYNDAGAAIRGKYGTFLSLWNAVPSDRFMIHEHQSINEVELVAYDKSMLRAPGYDGVDKKSDYIQRDPRATNGLAFGVPKPDQKEDFGGKAKPRYLDGKGVSQSLLTADVQFAEGNDDQRTGNVNHRRGLALVQGDGMNYVMQPDILRDGGKDTPFQLFEHPAGEKATVKVDGHWYKWAVDDLENHTKTGSLSVYYAQQPDEVKLYKSDIKGWKTGNMTGEAIEAEYHTRSDGSQEVLTIMSPSITSDPEDYKTPYQGDGYSGVKVSDAQTGVTDYVTVSRGQQPVEQAGSSVTASTSLIRRKNGQDIMAFVANGTDLQFGKKRASGFHSTRTISFYERGTTAIVTVPGTDDATVTVKSGGHAVTKTFAGGSTHTIKV